jgi:hypothetical protein
LSPKTSDGAAFFFGQNERDPSKPFYSHHAATSYLRNTLLPDGLPAVKEDVERYLLGHAGKDVHAGYSEQWIKTLCGDRDHPQPAPSASSCCRRWRSAAC